MASKVARPTATPPCGATDWILDAVLMVSPARNGSPDPGATPSRTRTSPVLTPTRRRNGEPSRESRPGSPSRDTKCRPHGTLGVVLVGRGDAEHPEHRVADELLDDAAVSLDRGARHGEVGTRAFGRRFRVRCLGQRREPDQAAEQRRDDLPLLRVPTALDASRRDPHRLQNCAPSGFSPPHTRHRIILGSLREPSVSDEPGSARLQSAP